MVRSAGRLRPWARLARAALAVLVLAFGSVASPPAALAHAELVGSEPADGAALPGPPARVRLFFSEPIERDFFALEVYTAQRQRVDRRDARIPPDNVQALEAHIQDLGPGIYTVVWRVLSIDGHVVRGVFAFSVGVAGPAAGTATLPAGLELGGAPFALGAAVRWLTFLAAALLVGGFAFAPLVLAPALSGVGPAGPAAAQQAARRFLWVGWPAVVLLLILTLAALLLQAADATGQTLGEVLGGRALTRLLSGTKYGALWLARAGLVAALLFALTAAAIAARPRHVVHWAGVGLGALLLLVFAATGHASAVPRQSALAMAADWAHLLAGSIWVGGLVQLAVAFPAALAALDAPGRRTALARTVRGFSWLASACVAAVVGTGVYAGVIHVPSWQALADTVYGAALSGKLLLVAPLLALGAANLLIMHPRFVGAARHVATTRSPRAATGRPAVDAGSAEDAAGRRVFRGLVLGEVILAVLVLAVTGILTGLPPATASPGEGRPVRETARAGDLSVTLEVDPNQAGTNTFRILLADAQGRPAQAERVTLSLGHLDMDMGPREVEAIFVGASRYEAVGGYLSMAGRWQAEVRVRRAGAAGTPGAEASARYTFTVGQPPGTGRPAFSPARILVNALTPQTGLGALILVLAAVLFAQRPRARRRQRAPLALAGATLAAIGCVATGTSLAAAYRQSVAVALPVANPVPATAESLARGQQLYTQSCMVCHGVSGRGDGPAGRALRPPPADFRVHMAAGHTDAQLFEWITNGVPGTAMPAFKEQIPSEDRWHLINYIRTFAGSGAAAAPGGAAGPSGAGP